MTKSTVVADLDIQALVDDELDDLEKTRVLAVLCTDPALKSRFERLLSLKRQIIAAWFDEERKSLH